MGHINIAEYNTAIIENNLGMCYDFIKSKCGIDKQHFAYPYGRYFHFNKTAFDIAFKIGFMSCASAERGCHTSSDKEVLKNNQLLIRRDLVICKWNKDHIFYFMANNARKFSIVNA